MASHEKNQDGSADVFATPQSQPGLTPQELGSDCCRHKHREQPEADALLRRLSRIEGQVRGIQNMLENDAYCADILVQVAAVNAALNSFNKVLLANHVRTCVADNIRQGNDEVIEELVTLLQKLMR